MMVNDVAEGVEVMNSDWCSKRTGAVVNKSNLLLGFQQEEQRTSDVFAGPRRSGVSQMEKNLIAVRSYTEEKSAVPYAVRTV